MAIAVGDVVLVQYGGFPMWHERLVCAVVVAPEYVVCTPTYDFFAEELSMANPDLSGVEVYMLDGTPPPPINPHMIFGFPAFDFVRHRRLLAERGRLADLERARLGLVPAIAVGGVPVAAVLPPAAAAVLPAVGALPGAGAGALQWVLDEPLLHHEVGDLMPVPVGAPQLGDRALIMVGTEVAVCRLLPPGTTVLSYAAARRDFLADDDRILASPLIRTGGEFRALALACEPTTTISMPLEGPRTAHFVVGEVIKLGIGNFSSRHQKWLRDSGVEQNSREVHEHRLLSKILDLALLFDRLNIVNAACFELIFRRMQLMEDVHADDPKNQIGKAPSCIWASLNDQVGL